MKFTNLGRGPSIAAGAVLILVVAFFGFVSARADIRPSSTGTAVFTAPSVPSSTRASADASPAAVPPGAAEPTAASPVARGSAGAVDRPVSAPRSRRNCARSPSSCGYPDHTNTGWRHTGVTLKVVTVQDIYTIDKPGAIVDGLDIRGCVQVRARNVTIRRSKITCDQQPMLRNFEADGKGGVVDIGAGLVVEDVEFDGMKNPDAQAMAFNNYTVRRSDFHDLGAAVKLGSGVHVEDSYVHDIAPAGESHVGGFPSDGGVGITLRHNTVLMNSRGGYAVAIYNQIPAGSVVKDVVVDGNLLAGGNFTLYCGAPGEIAPNLRVTNNRFSGMLYPKGGFYGPSSNCVGAARWSNNYWDHSAATVAPY